MTETQATSGITGTSMNPGERDLDVETIASTDRSAVGRASVPIDSASSLKADSKIDTATSNGGRVEGQPVEVTTGRPMSSAPGAATSSRRVSATRTAGSAAVMAPGAPPSTGAARVAEAVRSARSTVSAAAGRGPRRARLFVKRVDPWSVMKFAFAVSFVMFFVLVVATSVLYLALDSMHVFASVNKALSEIVGGGNKNIKITAGVVIGASGAIGLVMVVLCTALATLGAFIYNVCADLVGGIEVTLSEKE
jgi:hypothetical protein